MAVVIQEMVPSAFSGVMFTVDPVTGDPSNPYITANYGLGEVNFINYNVLYFFLFSLRKYYNSEFVVMNFKELQF